MILCQPIRGEYYLGEGAGIALHHIRVSIEREGGVAAVPVGGDISSSHVRRLLGQR